MAKADNGEEGPPAQSTDGRDGKYPLAACLGRKRPNLHHDQRGHPLP